MTGGEPGGVRLKTFDPASAVMSLVASVAILGAAWLRFGPAPAPEPPAPGAPLPALKLIDPETNEPVLLLGLRDKVVWVTFWSATAPEARSDLTDLERVWGRFKPREKFVMAAVAVDGARPGPVLSAVAMAKASLPVYLAAPETRERFGADAARLPLHLLVDETGRVAAVAQGRDGATLARLAEGARRHLDRIDPVGSTRFAAGVRTGSDLSPSNESSRDAILAADLDNILERPSDLFVRRVVSGNIRSDDGPEFGTKVVRVGPGCVGLKALSIEPGSPPMNGSTESFHGELRDEWPGGKVFNLLMKAKARIDLG